MRRVLLRFLALAGTVALLIAVIVPQLVRADRFRSPLEDALSTMTGRHIEMRRLSYSWFHQALVADEFTIPEDPAFGRVPFLEARRVEFHIPVWAVLFSGRPQARTITFDSPTIVFKEDTQNRWNYTSLLTAFSRGPADMPSPAIEIRNGRLGVESDNSQLMQMHDLQMSISRLQTQAATPFTLTAAFGHSGVLKMKGQAGPVDWDRGQLLLPVNTLIHLAGFNIAEWNSTPADGLGGWLTIEGSLESTGRALVMNGQAIGNHIRLTRSGERAADRLEAVFTLHHDLQAHAGELNQCEIRVTKGSLTLTGKYDTQVNPVQIHVQLAASGAPVTQLAPFLASLGIALPPGANLEGGVFDSNLALDGPIFHPTVSGPLSVDDTHLNHFYLSQRLASVPGLDAGELDDSAEILSFKANFQPDAAALSIHDMVADVAGLGELTGSGAIFPNGGVRFRLSGIRGLTGPKGKSIPFTITGTSRDPVFQPAADSSR